MKCDFCSDDPIWSFPCDTFKIDELGTTSVGAWAACQECADLVEAGKWQELAERSCTKIRSWRIFGQALGKDLAIKRVLNIHSQFREHRTCEKQRLGGVN